MECTHQVLLNCHSYWSHGSFMKGMKNRHSAGQSIAHNECQSMEAYGMLTRDNQETTSRR